MVWYKDTNFFALNLEGPFQSPTAAEMLL